MSNIRSISMAVVALLPLSACASAHRDGASAPRVAASISTDVLFEDEIARANVMTAYEAIARLRPGMLRFRPGIRDDRGADVYLDGLLVGSAEQLAGIPAAQVHAVRFVRSLDAPVRYAHVAPSGIIFITTKLGPRGSPAGR